MQTEEWLKPESWEKMRKSNTVCKFEQVPGIQKGTKTSPFRSTGATGRLFSRVKQDVSEKFRAESSRPSVSDPHLSGIFLVALECGEDVERPAGACGVCQVGLLEVETKLARATKGSAGYNNISLSFVELWK